MNAQEVVYPTGLCPYCLEAPPCPLPPTLWRRVRDAWFLAAWWPLRPVSSCLDRRPWWVRTCFTLTGYLPGRALPGETR